MKWVALDEELGWTPYHPEASAPNRGWLKYIRNSSCFKEIPNQLMDRLIAAESAMKAIQDEITAIERKDVECSE